MKGRREHGTFAALPHAYFKSPEYAALSARAVKALVDLLGQYNGHNNGDLSAAWWGRSQPGMSQLGWRSKDQLAKAIKELVESGWILLTRQGGLHVPSLYGVTFLGIDECGGKLDVRANPVPLNLWKSANRESVFARPKGRSVRKKTLPRHTGHSDPPHGSIRLLGFANYPATRVNRTSFGEIGAPPHGTLYRLYQGGDALRAADSQGSGVRHAA